MGEAFNRLLQAVRLQRDAFVWMDFNDRATGDALIFIVVTRVLMILGFGGSILGLATRFNGFAVLFRSLLNAAIFWFIYSGLTFAVARFLLQAGGSYAVYLRIVGFAYPTLLLVIFTSRISIAPLPALLLGSLWFLAVVTRGITYESDLPTERAVFVAAAGFIGWVIVVSILKYGLI